MDKVTATGIYLENRISVEAFKEDGSILLLVDGLEQKEIQNDFGQKLLNAPAIGGTFYPEPDTLLAAYTVLERNFFDKLEKIDVQGELEEIPNGENTIY